MKQETFEYLARPFRENAAYKKALNIVNQTLTTVIFISYPAYLALLLMQKDPALLRCILVPGITFLLVTMFRMLVSAPRPYEIYSLEPLIKRDAAGKSFPSRHVFSIFIIAMAFLYTQPLIGIVTLFAGILLAAVRVISGVHFPKDVLAGALLGIGLGLIGFYWIPWPI
ncbi:MAG: phosphatase PAP2 family protein [Lachnospiraceae bacterium]